MSVQSSAHAPVTPPRAICQPLSPRECPPTRPRESLEPNVCPQEHSPHLYYCSIVHTPVCHHGLSSSRSVSPRSDHSPDLEMLEVSTPQSVSPQQGPQLACFSGSLHTIACLCNPRMINLLCGHKSSHHPVFMSPVWHALSCVTPRL